MYVKQSLSEQRTSHELDSTWNWKYNDSLKNLVFKTPFQGSVKKATNS